MRLSLLILSAILISSVSFAQQTRTVSGNIIDTTGSPLSEISVNLKSADENLTTATNVSGGYRFTNVKSVDFVITVTSIGFQAYSQTYIVANKESGKAFTIKPIKLKIKSDELAEVVIIANPITIKEDTIEYRANAYKVRDGAPVEDLLKKLPGVTVDKDGVVTAQGKEIKRVRVNGKDYFGGDVQTATQNLPANIIENVQIISDYGDRANQTGIKEGEAEPILNINIQRGKNKGSFGNATVAAGTKERYLGRISANNFKENRQISLLGSLNNTNANTFNFNGGGRGGGARGSNFGGSERGGFGSDGTTKSSSLGLNYRDSWGKKIVTYGSYSFSGRSNNTIGTYYQEDNARYKRTTDNASNSFSKSANHRITWNLEYKIDSLNYLKVTPYYSYASSNNGSNSTSRIQLTKNDTTYYTLNNGRSQSNATTPAAGTDLFYIHRFKKRGRNFNISGTINYSERLQDRDAPNSYHDSSSVTLFATDSVRHQFIETNTANTTKNVRFSYDEPIGKSTFLELSYTWNNSSTKSLRDVNDVDAISGNKTKNIKQSNDYNFNFITNRYGLSFHQTKTKYNFLLGIVAQPSQLVGMDNGRNISTKNTDFNIAPTARFAYNFSRTNSLTANYNGSSREPNFAQLQPVIDSSNIKNLVIGNPNLKAEFTNQFSLQYNKVGILTGTSLFTNVSFNETQNKIVSNRIYQSTGTGRTTSYLNTNGFYSFNGNISLSQPFAKKKFTANINASATYDNNISFADNEKLTGKNFTIRPGARLRIDYTDIVDIDLSANYFINKNRTIHPIKDSVTKVNTLTLGVDGKNYFFKNYTLGYELTKIVNSGFTSSVSGNPTLLNLYVETRFLKNNKATIRIEGFDIFNQNTGISRTVTETGYTDVKNNRLGSYFLLSFNLRLQKFVGKQPQRDPNQKRDRQPGQGRGRGDGSGGGFRNGGGGGNRGGGRNN